MKVVLNIREKFDENQELLDFLEIDKWDNQYERCHPKLVEAVEKYCDHGECEFGFLGSRVEIVEVPEGKYYICRGDFNEEYLEKVDRW